MARPLVRSVQVAASVYSLCPIDVVPWLTCGGSLNVSRSRTSKIRVRRARDLPELLVELVVVQEVLLIRRQPPLMDVTVIFVLVPRQRHRVVLVGDVD